MRLKSILWLFLIVLLLFSSSCRVKVENDPRIPSLEGFTINQKKGRPFLINRNSTLRLKVVDNSQSSLVTISISALINNSRIKPLYVCSTPPISPCAFNWSITSLDNGQYQLSAKAINTNGDTSTLHYDGDDTNGTNVDEIDVWINIPN